MIFDAVFLHLQVFLRLSCEPALRINDLGYSIDVTNYSSTTCMFVSCLYYLNIFSADTRSLSLFPAKECSPPHGDE